MNLIKHITAFSNKLLGDAIITSPITVAYWGLVYAFGNVAIFSVFVILFTYHICEDKRSILIFKDVAYVAAVALLTVAASLLVGVHAGLLTGALLVMHNSLKWSLSK